MTENEYQILFDKLSDLMITTLEVIIGEDDYSLRKVNRWDSNIIERCLVNLAKLQMPFKYIATSIITSKSDGWEEKLKVFHDEEMDFRCTVKWENKTVICVLTVYVLAFD